MKLYYRIRQIYNQWYVLRYEEVDKKITPYRNGNFGPFTTIEIAKASAESSKKKMLNLDQQEITQKVPYVLGSSDQAGSS